MIRKLFVFGLGAGLVACSSSLVTTYPLSNTAISTELGTDAKMDSLIAPFSRELAAEMNVVIGESPTDLSVARPSSNLGNWATDAILDFAKDSLALNDLPVVVLLNTGGLRASISKGPITIGDVFKLMPFDNTVVVMKCDRSILDDLQSYLYKSGGEPISGMVINRGVLSLNPKQESNEFYLVTSDFLANGGDRMDFLQQAKEKRITGILIRDVFIRAVKKQQILQVTAEERISW